MNKSEIYQIVSGGLKSIAASFPVFSSIATAWDEVENRLYKNRIEEFFDKLNSRVKSLEKNYLM